MEPEEEDAYDLLRKGITFCFREKPPSLEKGRRLLERSAMLGRGDAWLYLGKSYALEKDWENAASAYENGIELGEGPCSYRLARLHLGGYLKSTEQEKHLEILRKLSAAGHLPSAGYLNSRRILGHEGPLGVLRGLAAFIPLLLTAVAVGISDLHSPRLEQ